MRKATVVGGIFFSRTNDEPAILTDERGHNQEEFESLELAERAAIRKFGVDVIFVSDSKHSYQLAIETH